MQFFQKKNGAVTIFLVLILVPVLVVTSIFVDVSRVQLAQMVVNSAGDLALNTILSQYDTDLNEFYGLIASCQSLEEFYETAEDYYERSLKSAGLESQGEAGAVAEILKEMLQGEQSETVDLLKLTWDGDSAVEFSEVENGNLANPAIVKKEIVEFMKYRSPINGTIDLLDKLKKSKKALEDSEKDAELIDKRQEYYEAESEVLKTALEIYKSFKKYEELEITEDYVNNLRKDTESLPETYRKLDEKLVKDLYNTQGLEVFQKPEIDTNPIVEQRYSDSNPAGANRIGQAMDSYVQCLQEFQEARTSLENGLGLIPEYNSGIYDIQYWKYAADILQKGNVYRAYTDKANELCRKYAALMEAVSYAEEEAMDTTYTIGYFEGAASYGEKSLEEHRAALEQQYDSLAATYLNNGGDEYFTVGNRLSDISGNHINDISSTGTNNQIYEIYTRMSGYQDKLEAAIEYLDSARDNLVKLRDLKDEYQNKKEAWSSTANGTDSELAKQDQKQIAELSQEKEIMANITGPKVDELAGRIDQVRALFYGIIDSLDDFKYNETPIKDISGYSAFKEKSGIDESRISYQKSQLDAYVQERQALVAAGSFHISIDNENNPAINAVHTPSLYRWIMDHFKEYETKKEEYEENKKKYEKYKEIQEKKGDGADTKGNSRNNNEISSEAGLPSKGAADSDGTKTESAISKIAEFTKAFCSDMGGTLAELGVTARDDLYSVDYIMSMFSYDTYGNEGKYNLCEEKGSADQLNLLNYQGIYQGVEGDWASTQVTFTGNKTLTNHMINEENNWSYQNEVEYILYGGTNGNNKAAAYSRIFLLRYALNLPAEFLNYWNEPLVIGISSGISAATLGVIPEGLVRLAIILTLTIMETGCDLLYLKAGMPVKLVKGDGDLFINFTAEGLLEDTIENAAKNAKKGNGNNAAFSGLDLSFQYSDYLKLFLFLKLFDEDKSYRVYARTADVIQANMRHTLVEGNEGFSMEKAVVYVQAESKLRVEPLMLDLNLVRSETDNRIDSLKDLDWCKISYQAARGY